MIKMPDFKKSFDYENDFYLSCATSRIGKLLAHYEIYKKTLGLPGEVVECGVFKGASFTRFGAFRDLIENSNSRKLIGFDIFGSFPETEYEEDKIKREHFIKNAGGESISVEQLEAILQYKRIDRNIELIKGDITKTIPEYLDKHPELKISLLNLDTDIYEPAVTILEYLYPRIVKGGILMLDDYGVFPGETKAVDDYFIGKNVKIEKLPLNETPCFIIKD
ncbi:dTDP-6-deoxy-L-hexose 3-O-methyltransferase [Anaeromicrobium sediminis]|uniref:dTDP-6-deoxy-L-hexose 3-O-methyltransferase n=2 Tax=Anaeromicrobium sediminis TaxID=1478221 RepID=A0A267MMJ8_9FIRM|nr:dTDP-6-deoxy-L-hexose 3-O-methyltransferase [Anaeromicrobium sediminis]